MERIRNVVDPREACVASAPSFTEGLRGDQGGATTRADGAVTEDDGVLPDGVTLFDDQYPGVANLDPDLLQALREAATDARDEASSSSSTAAGAPPSTRISSFVRRSQSTDRKRKLPDGSPPWTSPLTCLGTRSTSGLRCHRVAVGAWRRVWAVPDLQQRVLALRSAPPGGRSWLPSDVCRLHARIGG